MATDYAALKAGGFMRQKQKDTFSARLRVIGGTVTAEQLITIREVAEKYGNGYIHLTARQGIEIPFIKLEDIETVKEELAKGGVQIGVCGPRVRTVTACQGGRCCPSGCIDAYDIAEKLDGRYFGRKLPHKFKFGVTGCQNNCLKAEENDFGVKGALSVSWNPESCSGCGVCAKACRQGAITVSEGSVALDKNKCNHCGRCVSSCPTDAWEGKSSFLVSFAGTFGNEIKKGEEILPLIEDEETLFRVADAAIDYFDANANPGERFAKTLERLGWKEFTKAVKEAFAGSKSES